MASRREQQKEDDRRRVMLLISGNPEMSSRQIVDEVGISNGSAYYVLTALVEKGFVKLENFKNNPRKGLYAYLMTPEGVREKSLLAYRFVVRKWQEFNSLRAEIEALEEEVGLTVGVEASEGRIR